MDFHVEQNGEPQILDEQGIMGHLQQNGVPVTGVSPDGMSFNFQEQDAKGKPVQYSRTIPDVIDQMSKVPGSPLQGAVLKGTTPTHGASDATGIDPELSAVVHNADFDDVAKKSYLESKLRARGIANPQVVGMGDEWHVFNPTMQRWNQVTEKPAIFSRAGLENAAMNIPQVVGATMGGGLGGVGGAAIGGPAGGFAGAIGGGALGGASGQAAQQGLLEMLDPDYKAALQGAHGHPFMGLAEEGVKQGATMGGAKLLGTAAKASGLTGAAASLLKGGLGLPVKALKGLGEFLASTGETVADVAGPAAESDVASNLAGSTLPAMGSLDAAAFAAEAPATVVGALPRGMNWAADKLTSDVPLPFTGGKTMAPLMSEESGAALRRAAQGLTEPRGPFGTTSKVQSGAEKIAQALGQEAPETTAASEAPNVLGNLYKKFQVRRAYGGNPANAAEEQAARDTGAQWQRLAQMNEASNPGYGLSEEQINRLGEEAATSPESQSFGDQLAQTYRGDTMSQLENQMGQSKNPGDVVGGWLAAMARAGRSGSNVVTGTGKGMFRAAQGTGRIAQGVGSGIQAGATVAQPLALPAQLRYGLPAAYDWWENRNQ